MSNSITVTLNGERRDLAAPTTVALLLVGLGFDHRKVAVERNNALVPRALYDATELAPGDALEIVHFLRS
jgi:thiamine biosynthesis protein ThiS